MGVDVWWDAKCLKSGQPWEEGFADGLFTSNVFVPVISAAALAPFSGLVAASCCDNVLLEYLLALEQNKRGHLRAIFPIFVGREAPDGEFSDFFKDGEGGLPVCGPVVVRSIEEKAREHLVRKHGPKGGALEVNTAATALAEICKHQGGFVRGDRDSSLNALAQSVLAMVAELQRGAEPELASSKRLSTGDNVKLVSDQGVDQRPSTTQRGFRAPAFGLLSKLARSMRQPSARQGSVRCCSVRDGSRPDAPSTKAPPGALSADADGRAPRGRASTDAKAASVYTDGSLAASRDPLRAEQPIGAGKLSAYLSAQSMRSEDKGRELRANPVLVRRMHSEQHAARRARAQTGAAPSGGLARLGLDMDGKGRGAAAKGARDPNQAQLNELGRWMQKSDGVTAGGSAAPTHHETALKAHATRRSLTAAEQDNSSARLLHAQSRARHSFAGPSAPDRSEPSHRCSDDSERERD